MGIELKKLFGASFAPALQYESINLHARSLLKYRKEINQCAIPLLPPPPHLLHHSHHCHWLQPDPRLPFPA